MRDEGDGSHAVAAVWSTFCFPRETCYVVSSPVFVLLSLLPPPHPLTTVRGER